MSEESVEAKSNKEAVGERSRPDSFEELLKWQPNANRAEGQAQFDYLSRLGGSIESLQRKSLQQNDSRGEIKAIGIYRQRRLRHSSHSSGLA